MGTSAINTADSIFSATLTQSNGLESLANAALQRGIDAFTSKDYEGAVKEFKRAVGIGRGSSFAADAAQFLAMSYLQLDDTDNAIKAYKSAFQVDPYRDDLHVKLGNLYFAQGKYEDARAEFAEAVRLNPGTVNRYSLGQAYIELGRFSDAETQYNEILRLAPQEAGGYLGMGLVYSRQGKHEEAIREFKQAIRVDEDLYDAYAQMGYSYADMGDMETAQDMVDSLERLDQADLADTLSRYMYKVDPPKMMFAESSNSFPFSLGKGTPLVALNSYLMNPNASKTLSIKIQFDKEMDRDSIENPANWQISRATGQGPGQAYNFGLQVSPNEAKLPPIPSSVTWDAENLTATVYFTVTQNAAANATIDPSHIEFKFSGKDISGLKMNPKFDQFSGFNDVA
ncbi:MAG: tetratricopeptide repeat protein [Deltaproteobacteria bacterium]|nr:tetratricopeptide repeat protein [Deltaproteobacteria bacterium]